jgi:hypothetical protein
MSRFVDVHLEPCAAAEDGLSMRFKAAGEPPRSVTEVPYESEDGVDGRWRVFAIDRDEAAAIAPATAILVEDSSDGVAWLVVGGAAGLRLAHPSGATAREPYLMLSKTSDLG